MPSSCAIGLSKASVWGVFTAENNLCAGAIFMKDNTILYIHSRAPIGKGLDVDGVKEGFQKGFGDIATVQFDQSNGLLESDFLENGKPIIYLVDWASTLHGMPSEPMRELFGFLKQKHPQTQIMARPYINAYEGMKDEGLIDHLLDAEMIDFVMDKETDVELINGILRI